MSIDLTNLVHSNNQPVLKSTVNKDIARKILHNAHEFALRNIPEFAQVNSRSDERLIELFDANNLNENILGVKSKSFTGTSNATGSGLIGRVYEEMGLTFTDTGVLKTSGIDFRANTTKESFINVLNSNGLKYTKTTNGTAPTFTDPSTFLPILVRLDSYQIEFSGYASVIKMAYNGGADSNELVNAILFMFEQAKEQLVDQIGVEAMLDTAGIIPNINNSSPSTYGPITTFMRKQIAALGGRNDRSNKPPVFYMNSGVYSRLFTEQAVGGQFLNDANGLNFIPTPVDPGFGFGGTFGGKNIYIVNEIGDSYQGSSTGALVASGGTQTNKSAIIFGKPSALFVRTGLPEDDSVFQYSGDEGKNLEMRRKGESVFNGETFAKAGIKAPALLNYVLV